MLQHLLRLDTVDAPFLVDFELPFRPVISSTIAIHMHSLFVQLVEGLVICYAVELTVHLRLMVSPAHVHQLHIIIPVNVKLWLCCCVGKELFREVLIAHILGVKPAYPIIQFLQ